MNEESSQENSLENSENQNSEKPKEPNVSDKKWAKWGLTTRWGYGQTPPTAEQKRAGWAKRKRNQAKAQMVLARSFIGNVYQVDEKGNPILGPDGKPVLVPSEFKEKLGRYFGLTMEEIEEMDMETAMMLRLVGQAIEKGDNQAAQLMLERAYGKPKEFVEFSEEEGNRPQINITVVTGLPETTPEILEIEEDLNYGTTQQEDSPKQDESPSVQ